MADTRYKMPAPIRKIGGKAYKYLMLGNKADAERWRDKGYDVRLVPWKGKRALYLRKK